MPSNRPNFDMPAVMIEASGLPVMVVFAPVNLEADDMLEPLLK